MLKVAGAEGEKVKGWMSEDEDRMKGVSVRGRRCI